mmetsp:Transcript_870/g.2874  ORF Transcript_870/g.2874 Transcript_870/m.2874 type:complete len:456 (-) Transcript_870:177-1544(-)
MAQAAAWEWTATGVEVTKGRADLFGHPREGEPFTGEHLATVQQSEALGYEDLASRGFIQPRAPQVSLLVYLDRGMDLKTQLSVPVGATIGAVKKLLAQSDPTGTVDPASFALKESGPSAPALRDGDTLPPGAAELELCGPPPPAQEPPPPRERKRAGGVRNSQWDRDCQVAFELAFPPRWEYQERDLGPRSIWSPLPDSANAEINAMARRGQRRGSIRLGTVELAVDIQEMTATPAGPRAMRRQIRKHGHQPQISKSDIMKLYLRYADELNEPDDSSGPDGVEGEGLLELFEDLGVDPAADVAALALSWACQARVMGTFRRREFICGCALLEVDSLEGLRSKMPELRNSLLSGKILPEVYAYTYTVALEPPLKVMPLEDASQYWALLLPGWALREDFCNWAEQHMKGKAVNRDLWMMVLKLAREVPADLSTYDEEPAWPVVIDEFVEYYRASKGG